MRVTRYLSSDVPFVMTQTDLQKLLDVLSEAFDQLTTEASCEDGLTRHFVAPTDALTYENLPPKAIGRLALKGAIREPPFSGATLSFDAKKSPSVRVDIDADEAVATELNAALEDRIVAMRPWFAGLATFSILRIVWSLQGLAIVGIGLYVLFMLLFGGATIAVDGHHRVRPSFFVIWLAIGLLPVIGWLLDNVRKRLFPVGTFALGHGLHRHTVCEKVRWAVVVGFAVSLAASLLVAGC